MLQVCTLQSICGMKRDESNGLWQFRESDGMRFGDRFILLVLVVAGIAGILYFADWWFRERHITTLWFFILLSLFFWYGIARLVLIWINYLHIRKPVQPLPERELTVAIFTTSSPGEPLEMFEKTLAACRNITYPHTTYLLDDTRDPRFREVAQRCGAVWLELVGLPGAKAGKVNKALELTSEEFILILDPDHIPFPDFLDRTLGFFRDEKVGFVQVSQAYYNQYRSFTAKGAAEQTYTFYGPTQMGLYGLGGAVAIGANCTFRRRALESIGGHGTGLAEDLITSVRLHAAGWRSVYHPVIVSRGLVPEDFGSFCKQQLKWSRGVFEVTFVEIPRNFSRLSGWQRLSYLMIGTYYLVGVSSFFFVLVPFLFFLTGILPASMSFAEFMVNGSVVTVLALLIYLYVQRWLVHPKMESGLHWRGMVLKFASWPVFFLGFLLGVVNAEIPYIPTAKKAVTGRFTPFARPLILQLVIFLIAVTVIFIRRRYFIPESELILSAEKTWAMIGFAFLSFLLSLGGVIAAWQEKHIKVEDPWDRVDLNDIKVDKNG